MPERRQRRKLVSPHGRTEKDSRPRSGLWFLPSLFTIGNIFCGYYSVIATLKGNYDHAAIAIGVGYILDGLDGRIARITGTSSDFGVQLDSLADVLTFGIAPAMLAFSWGLDSLGGTPIHQHVRTFGWIATFAFVMCGALRLARFNVQTQRPVELSSKRFFVGLPIPAGAGLVAAVVHFLKAPLDNVGSSLLWSMLVLMTAFLMISTIRYYSFKDLEIMRRSRSVVLVTAGLLIGLVFYYSEQVLLSMAVVYVASGPIGKLVQLVRRFMPSTAKPGETAHGNIKT
jgi:CDP-diacylglycerol--serine O-phosphatidyltransferase